MQHTRKTASLHFKVDGFESKIAGDLGGLLESCHFWKRKDMSRSNSGISVQPRSDLRHAISLYVSYNFALLQILLRS